MAEPTGLVDLDRISNLATELRLAIVSFIDTQKDLSILCLVSKTWHACAWPALWKTLSLPLPHHIAEEFISKLGKGDLGPIKYLRHLKCISTGSRRLSADLRNLSNEIVRLLPAENLTRAKFYQLPFRDLVKFMMRASSLTDLWITDTLHLLDNLTLEPLTARELTLRRISLTLMGQPSTIDHQLGAYLSFVIGSPSLECVSINIAPRSRVLIQPPYSLLSNMFWASRSTPIVDLRLRGVDLSALGHLPGFLDLRFDALKVLQLQECESTEILLDAISTTYEKDREQEGPKTSLHTFGYLTTEWYYQDPNLHSLRLSLQRFLSSFSTLRRLTISTYDCFLPNSWQVDVFPRFDLFKTHASTLEFLLVSLGNNDPRKIPLYLKEDLQSICSSCVNIKQLGLPLPWTMDLFHYDEILRLPKLHTLRITSCINDEFESRRFPFQEECLAELVRRGSPIQVCAFSPLLDYGKTARSGEYTAHRHVNVQQRDDGRVEKVEVEAVAVQDLDKGMTGILGKGNPTQFRARLAPI